MSPPVQADASATNPGTYIASAVLPYMPYSTEKLHASTYREPTRNRLLQHVERISIDELNRATLEYFEQGLLARTIETSALPPKLYVPAEGFVTIDQTDWLKPPYIEATVGSWIQNIPCVTVEKLLQHLDPACEGWDFQPTVGKAAELVDLSWQRRVSDADNTVVNSRLSMEIKCPWNFTEKDLDTFINMREPPTVFTEEQKAKKAKNLNKYQKLWCQIYDYAIVQGARFFIVSTYESWVFGCFSKNYSTAWVAPPIHYNSRGPTLVQYLIYWVQSAMSAEGGWLIPEVCGELPIPQRAEPFTRREVQRKHHKQMCAIARADVATSSPIYSHKTARAAAVARATFAVSSAS
ncbi:hypothetical protein BOTBODRAFT_55793 [Botryobasidium botryosum FD-172 SS1]|uniref:Uncharacterized protein n=1 Tax=Botryobasidium botryosum (strain FD-172 SS1) TaxID=930990 RepID=A0A067MEU7_BOTB1|nr:hypothetical protein BOTBODRAFT_55793 [Botryobasidium botryosum FD-172 SS1]